MQTKSLNAGESLTIGLTFNSDLSLSSTGNMLVYIGGILVGNLLTNIPPIRKNGIYYDIILSSNDTKNFRGYRDIMVILDDNNNIGIKKAIVGGLSFDRLPDNFFSSSKSYIRDIVIELKHSDFIN